MYTHTLENNVSSYHLRAQINCLLPVKNAQILQSMPEAVKFELLAAFGAVENCQ